jgi:transposase InsO family protein
MTDNAFAYIHRSLRELLAPREIEHLRTKPYRPQTNGKVERFQQTKAEIGPTASATATEPCDTGSSTTTRAGHTAASRAGHPSAAFTTSMGRTSSGGPRVAILSGDEVATRS